MCSIIVNTCDSYEDTWNPFFNLFKEYWTDCEYPIYLNTEIKKFSMEDMQINVINNKVEVAWSDRLINVLHKVKTKYVILLLDDFFLNEKVDVIRIRKCIQWMEKNNKIASFSFAPSLWKDIDDKKYEGFELRPIDGEYRFNLQAAIWNRKTLLKILKKGESPWETEHMGTFRAKVLYANKLFYAAKKEGERIITYEYGGAIHQGRWTKATPELLKHHKIEGIDFSVRGFDPKPTEEWSRLQLECDNQTYVKKSFKIKLGEILLAKGIIKKHQ